MFSNLLVGSSISFTDTLREAFKLTRFDQLQCMLYPFLSFLHSTNNSVLIIEWREKKRENETRQVSGLFSWKKETKREERKRKHSRRCQRLIMISYSLLVSKMKGRWANKMWRRMMIFQFSSLLFLWEQSKHFWFNSSLCSWGSPSKLSGNTL